jgi:hypothetical protein
MSQMKRRTSVLITLFFFIQALAHVATAQEEKQTLRFVTFPKTSDPIKLSLLAGEGRTIQVEVASNAISKSVNMPVLTEWVVGEWVNTGRDTPPKFSVFGKVNNAGSPHQIVIVIRRTEKISDGCKLIALSDKTGDFGPGKMLLLNAADKPIGGIVGGRKFAISSGQHAIIEPEMNETGRYFHAQMFYEKDGMAKSFFTSNWVHSKTSRSISFIYNDPSTHQLRFHHVRDFGQDRP